MRTSARGFARWRVVVVVALALMLGASVGARASHIFSDIPTPHIAHDASEWLRNRNITLGCSTGLYCPDAFVTRAQMALFMQRLGAVFTDATFFSPTFTGGAPLDPDASPIVCTTTGSPYTPTYPQSMVLAGSVTILASGAMNTQIQIVYSINGGGTWTGLASTGGPSPAGSANADVWYRSGRSAQLNMDPNVTYVFGMRVTRVAPGGTADGTDYRCGLQLNPFNRNPTTSPLRVQSGPRNAP